MSYTDKAELTREYYRKQGELRERERIANLLKERLGNGDKTWSPLFIIGLIEQGDNANL